MNLKICSVCGKGKLRIEFHKDGGDRLRSSCKSCNNARIRSLRIRNTRDKNGRIQDTQAVDSPGTLPPLRASNKQSNKKKKPEGHGREVQDLVKQHRRDTEVRALKAEQKRLLHSLEIAEKRVRVTDELNNFSAPPIRRRERASGLREATAVVLCSDWHVEETVTYEKTNGMNEYNLDIADRRIDKLTDGILWLLDMHKSKFTIHDLVLWLGGDLMSGYIHEELEESNSLSPIETVLWLQHRIVRVIDTLLEETSLQRIVVPCSFGNHGRNAKKKRISTGAENSYEWLLYQQLKAWYETHSNRVEIVAPKSQLIYLPVYDFTLRLAHGDQIGYGGGVGGVTIPLNKRIANWDYGRRADFTCIGHFHQLLSLPNAVVNGSLVGFSPFAVSIGARFEPPQQGFFLIDSRRGKTASYPIWVDDRLEEILEQKSETRRGKSKKNKKRR